MKGMMRLHEEVTVKVVHKNMAILEYIFMRPARLSQNNQDNLNSADYSSQIHTTRYQIGKLAIGPILAFGALILFLFGLFDSNIEMSVFGFFILFIILVIYLSVYLSKLTQLKAGNPAFYSGANAIYTFDDEGIKLSVANCKLSYRWGLVDNITMYSEYFIIEASDSNAREFIALLPYECFENNANLYTFKHLIKSNVDQSKLFLQGF